jgi:uncharacterized protein (TIRG00374 family)
MKISVKQLFKVVLSLALLGYLVCMVDWHQCLQIARRADILLMAAAVLLLTLERVLSVVKWRLFISVVNKAVSFWRLFIINYVGGFWGLVLPSSVSADIVRGFYLSKATADLNLTVTSMAVDRFISGLSLVVLASFGGWYVGGQAGFERLRELAILMAAIMALGMILLFQRKFLRWVDKAFVQRFSRWTITRTAREWLVACVRYQKYPGLLISAFLLSLSVQIVRVLVFYVVALGFDLHVPLIYYIVFIPLIMVLIMLPSINGIGVREVSFVSFFSLVGMPQSEAFVVSFAVSVITTLTTAAGGIIYMFDKGVSGSRGNAEGRMQKAETKSQ